MPRRGLGRSVLLDHSGQSLDFRSDDAFQSTGRSIVRAADASHSVGCAFDESTCEATEPSRTLVSASAHRIGAESVELLLHDLKQLSRGIRFRQEGATIRQLFVGYGYCPRGDDQADIRSQAVDLVSKAEAVHLAWHVHVGEDEPDVGVLGQHVERFAGVSGLPCHDPVIGQGVGSDHSDEWLVFDDEDFLRE